MSNSVPAPATLPTLNAGDFINYKGQQVQISAVSAGVDDGQGTVNYNVTLNTVGNPVIVCSANNTVINNPGTEAASTGVEVWSRSGQSS